MTLWTQVKYPISQVDIANKTQYVLNDCPIYNKQTTHCNSICVYIQAHSFRFSFRCPNVECGCDICCDFYYLLTRVKSFFVGNYNVDT